MLYSLHSGTPVISTVAIIKHGVKRDMIQVFPRRWNSLTHLKCFYLKAKAFTLLHVPYSLHGGTTVIRTVAISKDGVKRGMIEVFAPLPRP